MACGITKSPVLAFVLLDVALVACLLSMLLCLDPLEFAFISEWISQCKHGRHGFVLPYLLIAILALVSFLQLNWMYLVSLHHLNATAHREVGQRRRHNGPGNTRTDMVQMMLFARPPHESAGASGNSDLAFVAGLAVVIGIAAVVHFDWTSPSKWPHYYGVFLLSAGFMVMLQIIWWNMQTACSVGHLRSMNLMTGMHWALDTAIVLFVFLFMVTAFLLGHTGAVVVSSELIAFTLLMLQFVYTFSVCCRNIPPQLPRRPSSGWFRVWSCCAMLAPFLLVGNF
jgi:hypothetical protein